MPVPDELIAEKVATKRSKQLICYHCATPCANGNIRIDEKYFCCDGCKLVYEILQDNGLCDYYKLQDHPGLAQVKVARRDKYDYLDDINIARVLYTFTDSKSSVVKFYIPGVHCSSCMWLLEHMHRLNEGITESRLNFTTKEVTIRFLNNKISLRQVVELLTTIGYEPYISLNETDKNNNVIPNRQKIYKLGIAGFCFGNIMMMSFPEYLSHQFGIDHQYTHLFRTLNLLLALPVFFYSASEFFSSAWAGVKQRVLNIDAPIVLALIITFSRSLYEIFTNTGSGYLDSMSGIVFFMLVGRIVQERTYKSLSFHRDYRSYFPIAVNVMTTNGLVARSLQDIKVNDVVQIHNEEIIPADALVIEGDALIDYSFVTGESEPVKIGIGNTVYAGGKQTGENVLLQLIKPVTGSYLTSLWNHHSFSRQKAVDNNKNSIVHLLSKYFTYILLLLAAITTIYWYVNDPAKILPSVSAMLIVACPCALLLSASYTNGNILRLLSDNGLYLRDASVIEQLGKINHIVFDKTGTLTQGSSHYTTTGHQLSETEKSWVYNVVISSRHPYSRALATFIGPSTQLKIEQWKEIPGKGVQALIGDNIIKIGSAAFIGITPLAIEEQPVLYIAINDTITAFFIHAGLRKEVQEVIECISGRYDLSMLSGDNNKQLPEMRTLFGSRSDLRFDQSPIDKLEYIEHIQEKGKKVLMVGDGLNDAGALQQADVGITLADDINNFSPACDAILDADQLDHFPALLRLSKSARYIINTSFIISILYNIVGLYFSVQGKMNPMIAAILMPASTLSIVLVSTFSSSIIAKRLSLSLVSRSV